MQQTLTFLTVVEPPKTRAVCEIVDEESSLWAVLQYHRATTSGMYPVQIYIIITSHHTALFYTSCLHFLLSVMWTVF